MVEKIRTPIFGQNQPKMAKLGENGFLEFLERYATNGPRRDLFF